MRLLLVRHCSSIGQEASAPLTAEGQDQAVLLADRLEAIGPDLLVSSPYLRARQSIAPLAQRLGLPVEIDDRLAERTLSLPPLEGWRGAIRDSFEDIDLVYSGGESSRTAMARGRAAVDKLLARPAQTVVVVTHGNLMTLILRSFDRRFGFSTWERLSNPDVYCIDLRSESLCVFRAWATG